MRRAAMAVLAVAATLVVLPSLAAGAGSGSGVPITVAPATGKPSTHFVISFRAPETTTDARTGGARYELSASGHARRGCASSASSAVGPTRKGERVHVVLPPPGPSHAWCKGAYSGEVIEIITPNCPPRELCPAFIAELPVGKFSFRVR